MTKSCCSEVSVSILSSPPGEDVEGKAAENGEGVLGSQNERSGTGGVSLSMQSG